jgi:arabinose-5-phosphate isomerase
LAVAKQTILSEASQLNYVVGRFADAAEIYNSARLVVTGIGKISLHKKWWPHLTLGTPSLFLHASEAIHGDLGMVEGRYYHLHFKSGNSPEIKAVVPF